MLRLAQLDQPAGKVFDEIYYATEGWDLLEHGVEWNDKDARPRTSCTRRWANG